MQQCQSFEGALLSQKPKSVALARLIGVQFVVWGAAS